MVRAFFGKIFHEKLSFEEIVNFSTIPKSISEVSSVPKTPVKEIVNLSIIPKSISNTPVKEISRHKRVKSSLAQS